MPPPSSAGRSSDDTAAIGSTTDDATAAIPVAPASDTPQWRVGSRYRVVDRLGSGGMADVFRAHDELLARDVAVKVFRAQHHAPETETSANRQLAELHALARLNHPNLITLFDGSITEADGPAYLVMELVDGATLADRIADGPLPPHEVRELGAQIAAALSYVHAEGMVHRDVKPANILLGADRTDQGSTLRARLSDFGIVRLLGTERMTSVDFTLGTASYLAPEQARGADVGPPADVYSLGLVLIEALSGVRSFDGSPLEAALARLDRDPEIPADLSPAWSSLLGAMTARDPAARPTAAQVARLLRDDRATSGAVLGDADGATQALRLPAAAAAGAGAGYAAAHDDDVVGHPGRGRMFAWLSLAAIALAAIVVGGVMVLRPSTPADSKAPTGGPSASAPAAGAGSGKASKASTGISPVSVNSTTSRPSRSASTSASSSAATSAAAKTSAPATTSAANPVASSRPAASSSAAPAPSTSAAASTPAAATSTSTTATNAAASTPVAAGPSGP